jgi:hypothetical protein
MSSDAEEEIPRETSAAAEQQGSGTALKASLAVLGLLFCFGVGLVGETYFREWRAKPAQVTAQLPQTEASRSPEITPKPTSAPPAETKLAATAKPVLVTAPPRPPAAPVSEASSLNAQAVAAATGPAMNSKEPSATTAAALAALTPAAAPDVTPPAVSAAAPPAAKIKPAVKAAHAATKPSIGAGSAGAAAASGLHYRVQFGAFAIEDNAEALRRAIETPKMQISITPAADNSGRLLYHVRSPAFASYSDALSAIREAQDAARRAQFGETVQHVIQKVGDSDASPTDQAHVQAAQSADH